MVRCLTGAQLHEGPSRQHYGLQATLHTSTNTGMQATDVANRRRDDKVRGANFQARGRRKTKLHRVFRHLGRSVGADKRVHRPIRLLIFGWCGRVQRLVHTQPCSESSHHRTPHRHTSHQPPSLVTTPAPAASSVSRATSNPPNQQEQ